MPGRFKLAVYIFFVVALLLACDVPQLLSFSTSDSAEATSAPYVVQPGDTFSKIAQNYGITVEQLIDLNADAHPELARDPSTLKPGMQLKVPNRAVSLATRAAETKIAPTPRADLAETARLIIEKINDQRAGKKIFLLREDSRLTRIAQDRSNDMIQRGYFSHYDPQNGQEPFLRYLQAANYPYQFAGENIAEIENEANWVPSLLNVAARFSAADLADQFTTGWLNSNEHRENIFSSRYAHTGVGIAVNNEGTRIVATQVFSD